MSFVFHCALIRLRDPPEGQQATPNFLEDVIKPNYRRMLLKSSPSDGFNEKIEDRDPEFFHLRADKYDRVGQTFEKGEGWKLSFPILFRRRRKDHVSVSNGGVWEDRA